MELVAPLKLLINTNVHRFYQRTHTRELNWATNISLHIRIMQADTDDY